MPTDLRELALKRPLPPGGSVAPYTRRHMTSAGLLLTAAMTTEICGCLGPVWHLSVSLQQPGVSMVDGEVFCHMVARKMLEEVGRPERELWWWNTDALVGHLRVHLTNGELLRQGPVEAELPDDHDEPGVWLDRNSPLSGGMSI